MCVHCHHEIDDNVQARKEVLQLRNESAESEKCGVPHWSFDKTKWLSHKEMDETMKQSRRRNVVWQTQIDYQGSGRQSGGTYAYLDPEFHTNKALFWGEDTATITVKQESSDLVESRNSSSSSSNQVPVKEEDISAANAAPEESIPVA